MVKIGIDGAVGVRDESGYGVVTGGETGILCTTCRFNKRTCPHVTRVVSAIEESQADLPEFLLPLSLCLKSTKSGANKSPPLASLQSTKLIPFVVPPSLAQVLTSPFSERFGIVNGVCYLSDRCSSTCSLCGAIMLEMESSHSTVVTQNQVLPAKGIDHGLYLVCDLSLHVAYSISQELQYV